jgi:hypothetical protein
MASTSAKRVGRGSASSWQLSCSRRRAACGRTASGTKSAASALTSRSSWRAPAAENEAALASLFAEEARLRIAANIAGLTGAHRRLDELKDGAARRLLQAGAYTPAHPTGM